MGELSRLLMSRRTLIVVGPGGVGKTTAAAALGLQAACMGRKVLVLTVDPARRLATSMGLETIGGEPTRIPPARFAQAGIGLGAGALYAMVLDVQATFDGLIRQHAPSDGVAKRIMENPFYARAVHAMAGSHEYMAMEKLHAISEEDDFDLVVLDTPPTTNAIDFLTAPDRLGDFFDAGSNRVLMASWRAAGRLGVGLIRFNRLLLKVMNRFIGAETFLNLMEFLHAFHEMYDGFHDRAKQVKAMLRSPDVAFAIVSTTESLALDEGVFLHEQLQEEGLPFGAFVVNRVRMEKAEVVEPSLLADRLVASGDLPRESAEELARAAGDAARHDRVVSAVDKRRLETLGKRLGTRADQVVTVPLFTEDIHDLGALKRFADVVVPRTD